MLAIIAMVLGSASFAAVRALLGSGHPMLAALPPALRKGSAVAAFALEFAALLVALAMARSGQGWAVGLYALYVAANLTGVWLVLSRRI